MTIQRWLLAGSLGVATAIAACGKQDAGAGAGASGDTQASVSADAGGAAATLTPDAGGKVITVQMMTDAQGVNRFDPAHFDAKKGDVIRYTLQMGVHNAHFLPDSNPGKTGLPAAGPLLQLPGQTYDVKVAWDPGTYYFQCDPHAALGMIGHVKVTQ